MAKKSPVTPAVTRASKDLRKKASPDAALALEERGQIKRLEKKVERLEKKVDDVSKKVSGGAKKSSGSTAKPARKK